MEEELCPRGRAKLEMLESSGGGGGDDGRVWRRPRQGQRWQGRAGGRGARARQHAGGEHALRRLKRRSARTPATCSSASALARPRRWCDLRRGSRRPGLRSWRPTMASTRRSMRPRASSTAGACAATAHVRAERASEPAVLRGGSRWAGAARAVAHGHAAAST